MKSLFKDKKIVLRHAGLIDPESILDYIAVGGYKALAKALTTMQPTDIISEITQSKLRGRGGRLSNRKKWSIMYQAESDENTSSATPTRRPGAYMNRNEIESDPHAIIRE